MESVYFLYNNYPYLIAAYGYYKIANTGYQNVQTSLQIYNTAHGTYNYLFPKKIKDNWISLGKEMNDSVIILEPDKEFILIEIIIFIVQF